MSNKHNLKVGQIVWVHYKNYNNEEPKETKIKSIGKKYFTIECDTRYKYELEKLKIFIPNYYSDTRVILDKQHLIDEREKRDLENKIRKYITPYGPTYLTFQQLRDIYNLIVIK